MRSFTLIIIFDEDILRLYGDLRYIIIITRTVGDGVDDAHVVFAAINTIEHFDVRLRSVSTYAAYVCGPCITIDFLAVGVASRALLA